MKSLLSSTPASFAVLPSSAQVEMRWCTLEARESFGSREGRMTRFSVDSFRCRRAASIHLSAESRLSECPLEWPDGSRATATWWEGVVVAEEEVDLE